MAALMAATLLLAASDLPEAAIDATTIPALGDAKLAEIRGSGLPSGLPLVGLDQAEASIEAFGAPAILPDARPFNDLRDVTDNWSLTVANDLIAAATATAALNP